MISKQNGTVEAKEDIPTGGIIFTELPDISEQSITSQNLTACSNCGLSLIKPEDVFSSQHLASPDLKKAIKKAWPKRGTVRCHTCDRAIYCGESCRQEAWDSYHKVICPSSPTSPLAMLYDVRQSFRDVKASDGSSWQGWWNAEFSPILLAKVLVRNKVTCSPVNDDKDGSAGAFEKYTTDKAEPATHRVPRMFELMVDIFKRSKCLQFELSETEFNKFYCGIKYKAKCFHDVTDPLSQFVNRVKDDSKLFKKIGKYFQEPLPRADFHGLFPFVACLNHSCFPNAEIFSDQFNGKPGLVARARKKISKGSEILVSYIDTSLHRKERREALFRQYNFWCQCIKCNFEGDGPETCTQCGKNATQPKEIKAACENQARQGARKTSLPGEGNDGDVGETTSKNSTGAKSDSTRFNETPNIIKTIDAFNNCTPNIPSGENNNTQGCQTKSQSEGESDHCLNALLQYETLCLQDQSNSVSASTDSCLDNNQFRPTETESLDIKDCTKCRACSPKQAETSNNKHSSQCVRPQLFPQCSRCKKAWYCSQSCQKEAWKGGHGKICGKT